MSGITQKGHGYIPRGLLGTKQSTIKGNFSLGKASLYTGRNHFVQLDITQ